MRVKRLFQGFPTIQRDLKILAKFPVLVQWGGRVKVLVSFPASPIAKTGYTFRMTVNLVGHFGLVEVSGGERLVFF